MIAGGVSDACVQDLVLCAGAVVLNAALCFFVPFLRLAFVDCSTLVTDGVDNVGNWGFGCVIDLCRVLLLLLLLVYSGTLDLSGLYVVVVGIVAIYFLWCIARSVI